jgi:hypothetical protein
MIQIALYGKSFIPLTNTILLSTEGIPIFLYFYLPVDD